MLTSQISLLLCIVSCTVTVHFSGGGAENEATALHLWLSVCICIGASSDGEVRSGDGAVATLLLCQELVHMVRAMLLCLLLCKKMSRVLCAGIVGIYCS